MDAQSIWLLMTIGPSTEKGEINIILNAEESWNKTNKQDKFSSKWFISIGYSMDEQNR